MPLEFYAIVFVAIAIGAFAKGITGLGLPLVAMPVMAGFIGVERAIVVLLVPGLVTNLWLIWVHRRAVAAVREMRPFLVAAFAGIVVGTWVLASFDDRILTLLLAIWLGIYLAGVLLRRPIAVTPRRERVFAPVVGLGAGVAQGATGISGPLVASYFHARNMEPSAYVLAAASTFLMFQLVQSVALAGFGLLSWGRLLDSCLGVIPVLVVMPVALRLGRRISRGGFNRVIVALLIVMEAKLLYDGVLAA